MLNIKDKIPGDKLSTFEFNSMIKEINFKLDEIKANEKFQEKLINGEGIEIINNVIKSTISPTLNDEQFNIIQTQILEKFNLSDYYNKEQIDEQLNIIRNSIDNIGLQKYDVYDVYDNSNTGNTTFIKSASKYNICNTTITCAMYFNGGNRYNMNFLGINNYEDNKTFIIVGCKGYEISCKVTINNEEILNDIIPFNPNLLPISTKGWLIIKFDLIQCTVKLYHSNYEEFCLYEKTIKELKYIDDYFYITSGINGYTGNNISHNIFIGDMITPEEIVKFNPAPGKMYNTYSHLCINPIFNIKPLGNYLGGEISNYIKYIINNDFYKEIEINPMDKEKYGTFSCKFDSKYNAERLSCQFVNKVEITKGDLYIRNSLGNCKIYDENFSLLKDANTKGFNLLEGNTYWVYSFYSDASQGLQYKSFYTTHMHTINGCTLKLHDAYLIINKHSIHTPHKLLSNGKYNSEIDFTTDLKENSIRKMTPIIYSDVMPAPAETLLGTIYVSNTGDTYILSKTSITNDNHIWKKINN